MRTYATPGLCFDCSQALRGEPTCPRCGLPVAGADARRLAQLLLEADRVMAHLDAMRRRAPLPTASGPPSGLAPLPVSPTMTPEPRRHVSAGSVLLALGAGCLVVAAVVFVAVTWGSLSLGTRTLVLLGMTALAFAVTGFLTSRRLHGSVEALSAVAWTFLAIDLGAGRASGLFALDGLDTPMFLVVAGLVAAVPASLVVWSTRHLVEREPVVSSVIALGGWLLVMLGIGIDWSAQFAWLLVLLVVVAAALTVVYWMLELSRLAWALAAVATVLHVALLLTVASTCLSDDHRSLIADGRIWPVVAALAMTVLAAQGLRRHRFTRTYGTGVIVVAGVAVSVLAGLLVVAPAWHSGPGWGTAALCSVALGLTTLGRTADLSWASGPRVVAPVALLGCGLVALPWPVDVALGLARSMSRPWERAAGVHIRVVDLGDDLPLWTAAACLMTLAVAAVLVSTEERAVLTRRTAAVIGAVLAWAAGCLVVVVLTSLLVVAVLGVAVPGLVLLAAGVRARADALIFLGGAAVAAACALAIASTGLSLAVWSGALVVCATMLMRDPRTRTSVVWAFAGVLLAVGSTAAAVELAGGAAAAQSLALSVVVALVLVATIALPPMPARAAALLGALCATPLPVLLAVDQGPARVSLSLTVIGAAAALVGVLDRSRRPVGLAGASMLLGAWWLRLGASDIEVVEAYSGLPAAILIAAGMVAVLRRGRPTMQALLPGLTLAVAPSIPWAMVEPTSTRGLLLSAAGLALLAAGTVLRWSAPFLVGAGVVALMAFVHLAPYADAAPRWVTLATVGLVMLGVGVTWEARVRDLRSAAVYVAAMR